MPNYPVPYQNNWGYSGVGQQVYPQYQQTAMQPQQVSQAVQTVRGLEWVDGEVGAKAFQRPDWLPANQPIALWDTNDTVIYLKSWNQMGMPNQLQKAHYKLENYQSVSPMKSGDTEPAHDMSDYVKKSDLEKMKQDLIDTIGQMNTSGNNRRPERKGDAA